MPAALVILLVLAGDMRPASVPEMPDIVQSATATDGIYSWWVHPLAVNDGRYTWVGSIGAGTLGVPEALNRITRIGPGGEVETAELTGIAEPDDHNGVAIAYDPVQPELVVFYSRHNKENFVRYQTIDRDTLAVGPLRRLDFGSLVTYAQVWQNGSTIHLLSRTAAHNTWAYRTSPDWGQTWGEPRVFLDYTGFEDYYIIARPDPALPTRVWMGFAPHPPNSKHRLTYFAQLDLLTGEIRTASGDLLGNLSDPGGPEFTPARLQEAIDPPSGDHTRLLDIGTVGGQPAMAYAIWKGKAGEPEYRIRRWNGLLWSDLAWHLASGPEFGFTPNRRYLGGVAFGRDGELYTSRQAGQTWAVERWQWNRVGYSYELQQTVARSAARLIRPYVPWGAGPVALIHQSVPVYPGASDGQTSVYESDLWSYGVADEGPYRRRGLGGHHRD